MDLHREPELASGSPKNGVFFDRLDTDHPPLLAHQAAQGMAVGAEVGAYIDSATPGSNESRKLTQLGLALEAVDTGIAEHHDTRRHPPAPRPRPGRS